MELLNLSFEESLILLVILIPLAICLWCHLGTYQLDTKPKNNPEGKGQKADKRSLRSLYTISK
ncbi:Uncharacterised protein [Chlamydia trachomatis]|nr:Uncharacterised protein [Chlamydia trachomatis]